MGRGLVLIGYAAAPILWLCRCASANNNNNTITNTTTPTTNTTTITKTTTNMKRKQKTTYMHYWHRKQITKNTIGMTKKPINTSQTLGNSQKWPTILLTNSEAREKESQKDKKDLQEEQATLGIPDNIEDPRANLKDLTKDLIKGRDTQEKDTRTDPAILDTKESRAKANAKAERGVMIRKLHRPRSTPNAVYVDR